MLEKAKNLILPAFIIGFVTFSNLEAEIWYEQESLEILDVSEDVVPEYETLLYQAQLLKAKKTDNKPKPPPAPKADINKLVKDGVTTCYNAYKPSYDQAIAQERARLAGTGALNSSYAKLIPSIQAKSFAGTIINQISTLTLPLSPDERQVFWNIAGAEIKQVLNNFCQEHQGITSDLNEHIDNLINMKKTFGPLVVQYTARFLIISNNKAIYTKYAV